MKKCNVCDKKISDFAVTCPYCHSTQNQILPDIQEKKENWTKQHTQKHRWLSLVLSIVVIAIFSIWYIPYAPIYSILEFALEILCASYAFYLNVRHKATSIPKNKILILCAAVAGVLFSFVQFKFTVSLYGMGFLFTEGIHIRYKLFIILPYISKAILLSLIIIDIAYLIRSRKPVCTSKNKIILLISVCAFMITTFVFACSLNAYNVFIGRSVWGLGIIFFQQAVANHELQPIVTTMILSAIVALVSVIASIICSVPFFRNKIKK